VIELALIGGVGSVMVREQGRVPSYGVMNGRESCIQPTAVTPEL